jgi:hypothetical protein
VPRFGSVRIVRLELWGISCGLPMIRPELEID